MAIDISQRKRQIAANLLALEADYSDQGLAQVLKEAQALVYLMIFSDLEKWLLDLAEKDQLKIAYGLLALLYLEIDDLEKAKESSLTAGQYFPQTEMWGEIFKDCVMKAFSELKRPLSF